MLLQIICSIGEEAWYPYGVCSQKSQYLIWRRRTLRAKLLLFRMIIYPGDGSFRLSFVFTLQTSPSKVFNLQYIACIQYCLSIRRKKHPCTFWINSGCILKEENSDRWLYLECPLFWNQYLVLGTSIFDAYFFAWFTHSRPLFNCTCTRGFLNHFSSNKETIILLSW